MLTGEDSQEIREIAIARLTGTGDYQDVQTYEQLDFSIFTVDIFNEGWGLIFQKRSSYYVTSNLKAPIIFIQQQDVDSRKFEDKEYVVILGFYWETILITLWFLGSLIRRIVAITKIRCVDMYKQVIVLSLVAQQYILIKLQTTYLLNLLIRQSFLDMKLIKEAYF